MLTPVTPNPIAASTIKSHGSETRTAPGHNPVTAQSQPHVVSHSQGIGLDAGTILANVNAEAATAGNRTILQTLALSVAAQLGIARSDDETMEAFFFRIAAAIDDLSPDERLAVEIRSGLKALKVQVQALAAALRQPESALAARLVATAEAPLATPLKTAAAAATTTYLQQGGGVTRAAETLAMGTQARTNTEGNGLFSSAGAMPMRDRLPGDARSLQIQLKALFEPGVAETRMEIARKAEMPQVMHQGAAQGQEPEAIAEEPVSARQPDVIAKQTAIVPSAKGEAATISQPADLSRPALPAQSAQPGTPAGEQATIPDRLVAAKSEIPIRNPNPEQPDIDFMDAKPADEMHVDLKSIELKPSDTRHVEARPADVKPMAERQVDSKQAQAWQADAGHADERPMAERQVDPKQAQALQADAGQADEKPMAERQVDPKQADARRLYANPADTRQPDAKPTALTAAGPNFVTERREARSVEVAEIDVGPAEISSEPRTQTRSTPQNTNTPGVAVQFRAIAREIVQQKVQNDQQSTEAKADSRDQRVQTLMTLKGIAEAITGLTANVVVASILPQAVAEPRHHNPNAAKLSADAETPAAQSLDIGSERPAQKDAGNGHHSAPSATGDAEDADDLPARAAQRDQAELKPAARAIEHETALAVKTAASLDPVPFAYAALQPSKEEFKSETVDENGRHDDEDDNAGDGEPEDEDSRRERLARKATDDLLRADPEDEPELRITRDSSQADRAYALYQRMGGF
ncbi:MAG: hypothetical protein JWM58_3981 [Rhizobium sp.]|nr:hypothetical protein [Rhizobium sp.]